MGDSNGVTSNELRASATSSSVLVGNLFSSSGVNSSNFLLLARYLTGSSGSSSAVYNALDEMATAGANAEDFRSKVYGPKSVGQDVRVTVASLTWYVMYLSNYVEGSSEYTVLTLWLDNTPQLSSSSTYDSCAAKNGYIYYVPEQGAINSDNYGGEVYNNMQNFGNGSGVRYWFTSFYVSSNAVYQNSDTPLYIADRSNYPKTESAREILGMPYDLANESIGQMSDDGFYSPDNNNYPDESSSKTTNWFNSRIWLPSLSEIGYSGVSGLWGASPEQRSCSGTASGTITINGKEYNVANNTWTRSANYKKSYGYYFVKSSGEGKGIGATYARVVRPCVHLLIPAN